MQIGTIINLRPNCANDHLFDRFDGIDFNCVQMQSWSSEILTKELAESVLRQAEERNLKIVSFWAGYHGRGSWNFIEGPVNMGIVPESTRAMRLDDLRRGADFATWLGVPAIVTHCGFLPENRTDANYWGVCSALKEIGQYCKNKGLQFLFETGQETPVTLLRIIMECELDNLGINLDTANLIMYGKGNPYDALDTFGQYVRSIHVKDGLPPTNGMQLGEEVQVGTGAARYPELMKKLKARGYDGPFIIEREITEDESQRQQIAETVENLKKWWN